MSGGKIIMTIFIGAIITTAFILTFGNSIAGQTETRINVNETFTAGNVNTSVELIGRNVVGSVLEIYNITGDDITNNITIAQGIGSDGLLAVLATLNDLGGGIQEGLAMNISYVYEPDGYVNNSGARSITKLILIFSALAIVVFVIVVLFEKGSPLNKIIDGFK